MDEVTVTWTVIKRNWRLHERLHGPSDGCMGGYKEELAVTRMVT